MKFFELLSGIYLSLSDIRCVKYCSYTECISVFLVSKSHSEEKERRDFDFDFDEFWSEDTRREFVGFFLDSMLNAESNIFYLKDLEICRKMFQGRIEMKQRQKTNKSAFE